jgi:uncharacterized membrane protein
MSGSAWFVAGSAALASGVEFVEALTIVLAVGFTRRWRDAFEGTIAAAVALAVLVVVLGLGLLQLVPLDVLRTVIGTLLLLFGLKWLKKAILRYSGYKALHDEEAAFREEVETLRSRGIERGRDWFAVSTAFNGVFLEGLEVVFIVIGMGAAGRAMLPATLGAVAAAIIVIAAGIALHRPLKTVPENTLKFIVGIMLTSFGTLWMGEGLGVSWWHSDFFVPILVAGYAAAAGIFIAWLRSTAPARTAL